MDGWMDGWSASVNNFISVLESVDWMVVVFMSICLKRSPLLSWMADITALVESEVFGFLFKGRRSPFWLYVQVGMFIQTAMDYL